MGGLTAWIFPALVLASAAAITLWMAGAIYYDVCGGGKWGRLLAPGCGPLASFHCSRPGSRSGNRSPFC
jgi:hypothetical protein